MHKARTTAVVNAVIVFIVVVDKQTRKHKEKIKQQLGNITCINKTTIRKIKTNTTKMHIKIVFHVFIEENIKGNKLTIFKKKKTNKTL